MNFLIVLGVIHMECIAMVHFWEGFFSNYSSPSISTIRFVAEQLSLRTCRLQHQPWCVQPKSRSRNEWMSPERLAGRRERSWFRNTYTVQTNR